MVKGVASFFGVDLSASEEDLAKIYESIDLSDKFIILEDLERSEISITEILGYVNGLVEQDGVKVLLVANEKEILKYEEKETENNGEQESKAKKVLTKESQLYLRTKEKTISDTIPFYSSNVEAMTSIIKKFNNKYLNMLLEENTDIIEIIEKRIMSHININSYNLRSFIFACQKTIDMFEKIDFDADKDFLKNVFLGNVAFSLKNKEKENLKWEANNKTPAELGTYEYPFYRFAYDFVCNQFFDKKAFISANKEFISHNTFLDNENELKPHFQNIYSYYICSEEEVLESVNYIANVFLTTPERIPAIEYGKLANYLIAIKQDLECGDLVEKCKESMLNNLCEVNYLTRDEIMFHSTFQLETQEAIDEFYQFKKDMEEKLNKNDSSLFDFDYSIQNLQEFCSEVRSKSGTFTSKRCFAVKLDPDKFIELLKQCTAYQIQQLRGMFQSVYSFSNIDEFFSADKEALVILKNKIEEMAKTYESFDRIQLKQIKYLINNLEEYIKRL